MADLDSVRAILYSKNIDAANVKPYTGLHINATGKNSSSMTLIETIIYFR
jgi:hypothetical protein